MITEEEEAQSFYNIILNDVNQLVKTRCSEFGDKNRSVGVPNAPDRDVSKEELESIEYLNSARDVKLRLKEEILQLELQLKHHELSSVRAARVKSQSERKLAATVKDHVAQVEASRAVQVNCAALASRQASIAVKLENCESSLETYLSRAEMSKEQIKILEDILQHVNRSIEHLTGQMRLLGHDSLASLTRAIEATRLEADRANQELLDLRRQEDSLNSMLSG